LQKLERDQHDDCPDRRDDLAFATLAIRGLLIEDSSARKLFFPEQLDQIDQMARELIDRIGALLPAIPKPPKNGHA
jgi:hypothetical protein